MGGEERNKSNFLPKSQAFFIYISLRLYLKGKCWPVTSMRNSLFIFQPVGLCLAARALEVPLFGKGGMREKECEREGEWNMGERERESGFGPYLL